MSFMHIMLRLMDLDHSYRFDFGIWTSYLVWRAFFRSFAPPAEHVFLLGNSVAAELCLTLAIPRLDALPLDLLGFDLGVSLIAGCCGGLVTIYMLRGFLRFHGLGADVDYRQHSENLKSMEDSV